MIPNRITDCAQIPYPIYRRLCEEHEGYRRLWFEGRGPLQIEVESSPPLQNSPPPIGGPGTELKGLLRWLGFRSSGCGCDCAKHAAQMDREGPAWCRQNLEMIVGWLEAGAKKRRRRRVIASPGGAATIEDSTPFNRAIARRIVLAAIRRAERKAARQPLRLTQLLSIELGSDCQLGGLHAGRCPNRHPERYAHLETRREFDDQTIIRLVTQAYRDLGFRGYVAWHYYNEPLLEAERMFDLMSRIRRAVPWARFLLWTNGLALPADCREFAAFDQAFVSDYGLDCAPGIGCNLRHSWEGALRSLKRHVRRVTVLKGQLDGRLDAIGELADGPCARPFVELIIDHHGNAHICCYDWRGLVSPGNVFRHDLRKIAKRFVRIRETLDGRRMGADAPELCRRCRMRTARVHVFERAIGDQIERHRRERRRKEPPRIGVVFAHYKMPDWRLREHFQWNDAFYRQGGARVYVISDRPREVPEYAMVIVWPESKLPRLKRRRVFAITRAKNMGDRRAIEEGAEIVIDSDSDIAYTPESWARMTEIDPGEAVVPIYLKIRYWAQRNDNPPTLEDKGCSGVVARWADVCRAKPWEEGQIAYGCDDRTMLDRVEDFLHRAADRSVNVWHIDHVRQDRPDDGRPSIPWNQQTLNPPNFKQNRRWVKRRRKTHRWQPE